MTSSLNEISDDELQEAARTLIKAARLTLGMTSDARAANAARKTLDLALDLVPGESHAADGAATGGAK